MQDVSRTESPIVEFPPRWFQTCIGARLTFKNRASYI